MALRASRPHQNVPGAAFFRTGEILRKNKRVCGEAAPILLPGNSTLFTAHLRFYLRVEVKQEVRRGGRGRGAGRGQRSIRFIKFVRVKHSNNIPTTVNSRVNPCESRATELNK